MNLIFPEWPAPENVKSLVTTRQGGVSAAPFGSLNLATHVGDVETKVLVNRSRLEDSCKSRFGLSPEFYWLNQVHGPNAINLDGVDCEQERFVDSLSADASFTQSIGRSCVVLTADCLPILICDNHGTEVAAIHAGWKGLAMGVLSATLSLMSSDARECMAYLGPAISQRAFQVGADVLSSFLDQSARFGGAENVLSAFLSDPSSKDKYLADLFALARFELQENGIVDIYGGGACTVTDNDKFYSYRKDGQTGRFASAIWLSE